MKYFAVIALFLASACAHAQPSYLGSFDVGAIVNCPWNTYDQVTGAATTRATNGTPTVYEDFSAAAEITAGITDSEDFDGETGAHLLVIDTDSGNGYEAGKEYGLLVKDVGSGSPEISYSPWICTFSINTGTPLPADIVAINGDATAAPKLETFADASPVAQSGDVYPLVDTEVGALTTTVETIETDTDFLTAAVGTVQNLGSGATLAQNNADIVDEIQEGVFVYYSTVTTVTSQTLLITAADPGGDRSLLNRQICIQDITDGNADCAWVDGFSSATNEFTLSRAMRFTVAEADIVRIYPTERTFQ